MAGWINIFRKYPFMKGYTINEALDYSSLTNPIIGWETIKSLVVYSSELEIKDIYFIKII